MTRTAPSRRTEADYRNLSKQFLPHCRGCFNLSDRRCAECKALNDCLSEQK